jgi:hypothetical protein
MHASPEHSSSQLGDPAHVMQPTSSLESGAVLRRTNATPKFEPRAQSYDGLAASSSSSPSIGWPDATKRSGQPGSGDAVQFIGGVDSPCNCADALGALLAVRDRILFASWYLWWFSGSGRCQRPSVCYACQVAKVLAPVIRCMCAGKPLLPVSAAMVGRAAAEAVIPQSGSHLAEEAMAEQEVAAKAAAFLLGSTT